MDTANNVDHIMQSELLTCYDTLRPGLGKDDDISTNNSVVERLTYSNGLLQKLHETGDTQCKICHQDVLTSSSAIPVRLKECSHNKAFHLHCIRELAASMLTQVQLSETSTSTNAPAEQSTLPNSDQPAYINGASQAPQRIINQTQYQNIPGVGTLSHSQVLLFNVLHAKLCKNTCQCTIIPNCNEFKELHQHMQDCSSVPCNVKNCTEAKDIMQHFDMKPLHCFSAVGSHGCVVCGVIDKAMKGAQTIGDKFDQIKLSQVRTYAHFSIRPQNVGDTYQFFYQQPVKSVFTATGGEQMYLTNIMEYLQSEHFINYVTKFDIKEPTVKTNAHILSMNAVGTLLGAGRVQAMKQAFVEEGKRCAGMGDKYHIQIVFHGTSESNVRNILHNGLDPSLRRGQTLGQGEYFAANPALPLQYCGGGKKMLVFAVITCDSDLRGRDVIVVKDGARQLPIATLSFTGYEASALKSASTFKANVARLLNDANEKERVAKECRSKERIIQLILKNEYLAASDIYNKACDEKGMPPKLWAHEISAYVRDHIRDPETVEIYFPNLPPRPISTVHLDILNSDKCEEDAKAAKRKVESFQGIISSLNHFNASSQA